MFIKSHPLSNWFLRLSTHSLWCAIGPVNQVSIAHCSHLHHPNLSMNILWWWCWVGYRLIVIRLDTIIWLCHDFGRDLNGPRWSRRHHWWIALEIFLVNVDVKDAASSTSWDLLVWLEQRSFHFSLLRSFFSYFYYAFAIRNGPTSSQWPCHRFDPPLLGSGGLPLAAGHVVRRIIRLVSAPVPAASNQHPLSPRRSAEGQKNMNWIQLDAMWNSIFYRNMFIYVPNWIKMIHKQVKIQNKWLNLT